MSCIFYGPGVPGCAECEQSCSMCAGIGPCQFGRLCSCERAECVQRGSCTGHCCPICENSALIVPGSRPTGCPPSYDLFITIMEADGVRPPHKCDSCKPRIEVTARYPRTSLWHTCHKNPKRDHDQRMAPHERFAIPDFRLQDDCEVVEFYVHDSAHSKRLAGYGELTAADVRDLLGQCDPCCMERTILLVRPDKGARDKKERGQLRLQLQLFERATRACPRCCCVCPPAACAG